MSSARLLHDAFLERVEATPAATAVADRDERLSYADLERRSGAIAAELNRQGVLAGDRVGLALPKSVDAVAAALGVLRAGGAYVPLDEQSPPQRQALVLRDCEVRGLVTTRGGLERLRASGAELPRLEVRVDPAEHRDAARVSSRGPRPTPENPAYLLYTSGSTGQPKGVILSHRAASSFVNWAIRSFSLGAGERLANVAQLSFDLSILDVFGALSSGASVHLYGAELLMRPRELVRALREHRITSYYGVPSAITLLVHDGEIGAAPPGSLRRVLYAGEAFPVPQLRRAMEALPTARFHNLFGPTETNVCTHHALPTALAPDATAVPIGIPCDHLDVHLLDDRGRPVEDGCEGELCVGGPAVMSGYWGRPELTRAAFWPEGAVPGRGSLYRTGDRARRSSGLLWFLGRRDRQLKVRGYRVELGEIEAALASLPGARETAVLTVPDPAGLKLKALVVPEAGVDLDVLSVKSHCSRLLPPYMVPASVEVRGSLPRTATGKIDRARLR